MGCAGGGVRGFVPVRLRFVARAAALAEVEVAEEEKIAGAHADSCGAVRRGTPVMFVRSGLMKHRVHAMAAALAMAVAVRAAAQAAPSDVIVRAMRDELERSMTQLRLDSLAKPYFIAYRIDEDESVSASARLGALTRGADNRMIEC